MNTLKGRPAPPASEMAGIDAVIQPEEPADGTDQALLPLAEGRDRSSPSGTYPSPRFEGPVGFPDGARSV